MDVKLLGTGQPVPTLERAGTSIVVEIGDKTMMIDCDPNTTHRCIEIISIQVMSRNSFSHISTWITTPISSTL
jgi:ribonuclease BN (tRNA processing enzyme)